MLRLIFNHFEVNENNDYEKINIHPNRVLHTY